MKNVTRPNENFHSGEWKNLDRTFLFHIGFCEWQKAYYNWTITNGRGRKTQSAQMKCEKERHLFSKKCNFVASLFVLTALTNRKSLQFWRMKRLLTLLAVFVALGASACTNLLVGKKASKNGECFITYSADSYGMYGRLLHYAAGHHAAGDCGYVCADAAGA